MTNVFVDKRQRMHLTRVTGHLGVRLSATLPPWISTSGWTETENDRKTGKRPHSTSDTLHEQVDELAVPAAAGTVAA